MNYTTNPREESESKMSKCSHEQHYQVGAAWGYTGSVSVHPYTDEDRRAHGNITILVECRDCGARRKENHNQGYVEASPWGPSRKARHQEAERLQLAVPKPPLPVSLTCGDSRRRVTVSVDDDGMLQLSGSAYGDDDERAILAALPAKWIKSAQDYRRALLRAAEASAEV